MDRYSDKKIEGDAAARLITGVCGADAKRVDDIGYTRALTFKPE
ncbi:hypothetical protein AB5I41_09855 [Sphingomonas sp. MMS24-JH45]